MPDRVFPFFALLDDVIRTRHCDRDLRINTVNEGAVSKNNRNFADIKKYMEKRLVFTTTTEIVRVLPATVVYITADGNYSAITMADGEQFVLTLQLGQIEKRISEMLDKNDNRFIRIGKSLIVNRDFIVFINPARQKMSLSDCRTFRHEVSASKEALKALKDFLEKDNTR